ncbi:hypothetical protein ACPEEL_03715 [Pasteurella sp. PK-2025]|uniref:hypothetical protein n=1 Tax=unclassified Pasteurella TaxID=2621516 RepID=UPI003C737721
METIKIINSEQYQNLISSIQKKTKLKILNEYKDATANRDCQKMKLANLLADDALNLLKNDEATFVNFALMKMQKFENVKINEEYPSNEKMDVEDDNEIILGYSKSFLLLYLIEYFLLKTKPSELGFYLKTIRVPQAKKYEKELKEIYSKILL